MILKTMARRQRRRRRLAASCSVLLLALPTADTRTWESIIDPSASITADPGRDRLVEESDPFLTRTTPPPTFSPTFTAAPSPFPSSATPTVSSTPTPTRVPTERRTYSPRPTILTPSPSNAPSTETPFDCPSADTRYQVIMYDSWNDGWDGLNLTITRLLNDQQEELDAGSTTILVNRSRTSQVRVFSMEAAKDSSSNIVFQDTLSNGAVDFRSLCLRSGRCYEAAIPDGEWAEEITWEVKPYSMSENTTLKDVASVANGGAPRVCNFSIPDATSGAIACNNTCINFAVGDTVQEQNTPPLGDGVPDTSIPTPSPKEVTKATLITHDTLVDRGSARTRPIG